MTVIRIPSRPSLPDSIQDTDLDAALLVSALRETYRKLRFWADSASSEGDRALCLRFMQEIEQIIEGQGQRRRVWTAAKEDLITTFLEALNARPSELRERGRS